MDDLPNLLQRDYGLKPQGKGAPMAASVRSNVNVYDDVFGGPPKFTAQSFQNRNSEGGYDDIFRSFSTPISNSSVPVFDAPVYDNDDIFGGLKGLKSGSGVTYDDVFSGGGAGGGGIPGTAPIEEMLMGDVSGSSVGGLNSRHNRGFDHLGMQPGFGNGGGDAANKNSRLAGDSRLKHRSTTASQKAADNSLFSDPLEQLNMQSQPGRENNISSNGTKGFDGFMLTGHAVSSPMNKARVAKSPLRTSHSNSATYRSGDTETIEGKSHKKNSVTNNNYMKDHNKNHGGMARADLKRFSGTTEVSSKVSSPRQFRQPLHENSTYLSSLSSRGLSPLKKSDKGMGVVNERLVTVDEIKLRTKPTMLPPPSRAPPPLVINQGPSSNKILEAFASGGYHDQINDKSLHLMDGMMEGSSTAAASTSAMKEAMERAEAKLKLVKEAREKKRQDWDKEAKVAKLHEKERQNRRDESNAQEDKEQEEEERVMKAAQEDYGQEEKEKAAKVAREARERDEKEKAARAAREARERDEREKAARAAREARERDEREKAARAAREARERDEREKAARAAREARERDEREKAARAAREARERDEREKAARAARERDEKEKAAKAAREARERDEKEKAAKAAREAQERDEKEKAAKAAREARERDEREKSAKAAREAREREEKEKAVKVAQEACEREDKEAAAKAASVAREREEHEQEKERRKREREREREKDRIAVERATKEARERAEKAAAEARERVSAERVSTSVRERVAAEKAVTERVEARLRAERAVSERAMAEARERAAERVAVERAAAEARERAERAVAERAAAARERQRRNENDLEALFGIGACSDSAPKQRPSMDASGEVFQKATAGTPQSYKRSNLSSNTADDWTSLFTAPSNEVQDIPGESAERRRARLERHQRTLERAAKALAEKNDRDLQAQREQAERHRLAETLDADVKRWATGKESNLRALLSTLQYILWSESGWQPVSLTDVITAAAVKKVYRKATLCVHPDKVQQKGATIQQKYIAEKVFDLLKEAWNKFNSEELF